MHELSTDMRELSIDELTNVNAGGAGTVAAYIQLAIWAYQVGAHFAQDNGGPDPIYVY